MKEYKDLTAEERYCIMISLAQPRHRYEEAIKENAKHYDLDPKELLKMELETKAPFEEVSNKWISADEELPEDQTTFLAIDSYDGTMVVLEKTNDIYFTYGWDNCVPEGRIQYWMPLPNPPREE